LKRFLAISVLVLLAVSSPAGERPGAPSLHSVERQGQWGYADSAGKIVIPPQFAHAGVFSEGLAPVQKGSGLGFVNQSGKLVIPPKFDGLSWFSEGLAEVQTEGK
jgi:hypothetical protein